jgi:hypothetical protein
VVTLASDLEYAPQFTGYSRPGIHHANRRKTQQLRARVKALVHVFGKMGTDRRVSPVKRPTVPQSILAASAHFGVGDYRYREFPARSAFQIHTALSRSGLRLVEVEYRLAERFVIPAEPAAPTLVIERNRTALLQPLRQRPEVISVFK